jgi:branched-chain amino acid aminotransferase
VSVKVWIDGGLVDAATATVSAFDHGLLTGDGVFETLRVYRGEAFALRRHLERLAASAQGMGLALPASDVLRAAVEAVVETDAVVNGRIRITVTGGPAPLGSDRGPTGPTIIVAGGTLPEWPATTDVVVVPWPRNERSALAGLKTTSYGENVVALARASEAGAGEAIFGNLVGNLCEGTGSNVFCVIDGRLITPPLSSGCLAGVTRALLLELVPEAIEADVPLTDLASADEAFLTSTTREVQPIRAVDGHVLPSAPGPRTLAAAAAFSALTAANLDP